MISRISFFSILWIAGFHTHPLSARSNNVVFSCDSLNADDVDIRDLYSWVRFSSWVRDFSYELDALEKIPFEKKLERLRTYCIGTLSKDVSFDEIDKVPGVLNVLLTGAFVDDCEPLGDFAKVSTWMRSLTGLLGEEELFLRYKLFLKHHQKTSMSTFDAPMIPQLVEFLLTKSYNKHLLNEFPLICPSNPNLATTASVCFYGPYALKRNHNPASELEELQYSKLFSAEVKTLLNLKGINSNFRMEAFDFASRTLLVTNMGPNNILRQAEALGSLEEKKDFLSQSNRKFMSWLARYHALAPQNFDIKNMHFENISYKDMVLLNSEFVIFEHIESELKKIRKPWVRNNLLEKYRAFLANEPESLMATWALNDIDIRNFYPQSDVLFDFNAASLGPIEADLASAIYTIQSKELALLGPDHKGFIKEQIASSIETFMEIFPFETYEFGINYNLLRIFLGYKLVQESMYVTAERADILYKQVDRLFSLVEDDNPLDATISDLFYQ